MFVCVCVCMHACVHRLIERETQTDTFFVADDEEGGTCTSTAEMLECILCSESWSSPSPTPRGTTGATAALLSVWRRAAVSVS